MSGVFFIFLACLTWAVDTLIRYPLIYSGVDASKIVFTEHLILVVLFSPFILSLLKKLKKRPVIESGSFLIIGGLGSALATLAFTRAFALVNPSLVILLQKFQPVVAILLARVFLKETIKREFILWGALCLVGGAMISYSDIAPGLAKIEWNKSLLETKFLIGYGLTFLAVFGWGASTVFGKKLWNDHYQQKEIMAGRFFFGLLFLLPLMAGESFPIPANTQVFGKIILMVVISGLLGMVLYYQGLKRVSARLAALAEMFFPFCAIAVNWIFLDKALEPMQIFGGLLLLSGSTIIQIKHY